MKNKINNEIILKITSRCNLRCTYCHWFKDPMVMNFPKIMPVEIEDNFINRLDEHVRKYNLKTISIVMHGGEPLLFGKERMQNFCRKMRILEKQLGVNIQLSLTTNGMLINSEWVKIFKEYCIHVTVSIDGPKRIHDINRLLPNGLGSFEKVEAGINELKTNGIEFGVLAVANPEIDAEDVISGFVDELKIKSFDVLIPKLNHDDRKKGLVKSISSFYCKLFNLWYDKYSKEGVKIRICEDIARVLLKKEPRAQTIRGGRMRHISVESDGLLEPLYNLRISGNEQVNTGLNIADNSLDAVVTNPLWSHIKEMAETLPAKCLDCIYKDCCRGGFIGSRYSSKNGYDNPTVYCDDYKEIFDNAWNKIQEDLIIHANNA